MSAETNPAGRLYRLLQEIQVGDPKERVLDTWVRVFDIAGQSDTEVMKRLVMLNEMLDETERTIKLNPKLNHAIYLTSFPNIRTLFSPLHLQNTRESLITPHLTAEVMARLEFCSEALRDDWSEVEITPDKLQTIGVELNDLIERVAASDVAPALRKKLLEALETARLAISMYRIYGVKGLRGNLQTLFGLVITESASLKKESQQSADVIERLGKWIERVDSVSSKALKVHKALTKPVRYLLELVPKESEAGKDDDAEPHTIDA